MSRETVRTERPEAVWSQPRMLEELAWYPNEQIVRFIAKYLKKRKSLDTWQRLRPVQSVLDLGCGTGRHIKLFAEQGFQIHGLDLAFPNVRFANEWMRTLKLPAHCVVGSCTRIPYRPQTFDVVVSHGVLDHIRFEEAKASVREVRRLLRPGGLFYLDLISKENSGFETGHRVAEDTFIVPDGIEAGVVQRFYDEASLHTLLEPDFNLQEIIFQAWHPILGQGFSNLDKEASGPQKLARFHIVATPQLQRPTA